MITIDIKESVKTNGENSLFITFPYNPRIVDVIKNTEDRVWDAKRKVWEVNQNELSYILEQLPTEEFLINFNEKEPKEEINIPDYEFKTNPYEHQITALKYGLNKDKFFLGDEMGLGKTKEIIDLACIKKQLYNYTHCLIVCGINGLKYNWKREIETHSSETGYILGESDKSLSNNAKLADLNNIDSIKSYFLITNIETLRNKDVSDKLKELCKKKVINMIAVDEIHKCKNPQSQQTKGLLSLQAETMVGMTGTPIMNNPLDLYVIFKWLGYEKHNFYAFKNHYCNFGGYGGYEVIGYKNTEQLQEVLTNIMLRRKKEEVLSLPDKCYIDEILEMSKPQQQIYLDAKMEVQANIDNIKLSNNPLANMIRMRQATGCPSILSSIVEDNIKFDRMEEIVEESVSNGYKVVIFSNWIQVVNPAYERLCKKYRGTIITGETDEQTRQTNMKKFQEDSNCKFIIGTSGAMGTGITLTEGTVEIFLDEPWNMALKEQCVDRCHRIGQKNNLVIYTLMCKDTIDEKIHELVKKKGMISDCIVDTAKDNYNQELIDYLFQSL